MILDEIRKVIMDGEDFYITGHVNPDGDSVGASFALGLALEKLGKRVRVHLKPPYSEKYNIIPGQHLMRKRKLRDTAILICVDCADVNRLNEKCKKLATTLSCVINIDHHHTNTNFGSLNFVDGNASSASEMVYRLLDTFVGLSLGLSLEADKDIASALYAGILCDTGGFRFSSTSADTLNIVSRLVSFGIDFTDIYVELMHMRSYTEVKLLAKVFESAELSSDGRIIHSCVSQDMMTAVNAKSQDLEGLVEQMLNTKGVEISLLVYDKGKGEAKISLRSRSADISEIAKKFGGGGHKLAAGANVKGDIYEIREQVLGLL